MTLERKTVKFELKDSDEEEGVMIGYASTFSKSPDCYGDIIDSGAFKKTIKEQSSRIKVLWNHSVMEPIGRPVEMTEDEHGLLIKAKLSLGVQRAREILSLMKDGVVTEMSIGFETIKQSYEGGVRHLKEIKLYDVSPVTFAANPEALIVGVKEMGELKPYPNEHACRLRDPGEFQTGSFRRIARVSDGKEYSVIMGRLEGEDTMTEQAYRYGVDEWEKEDASDHCKRHDGNFEPAASDDGKADPEPEEDKAGRVLSSANKQKVESAISALQALLSASEREDEPEKSTQPPEDGEEGAAELRGLISSLKVASGNPSSDEIERLESMISSFEAEREGFNVEKSQERIEGLIQQLTK